MSLLCHCPNCPSSYQKLDWVYIPTAKGTYEPVNVTDILRLREIEKVEPHKPQFRWDATSCSFFVAAVYSVASERTSVTPLTVLHEMNCLGFNHELLTREVVSSKLQNLHNNLGTKHKKRKYQDSEEKNVSSGVAPKTQITEKREELLLTPLQTLSLGEVLAKICTDRIHENQLQGQESLLIPDLVHHLKSNPPNRTTVGNSKSAESDSNKSSDSENHKEKHNTEKIEARLRDSLTISSKGNEEQKPVKRSSHVCVRKVGVKKRAFPAGLIRSSVSVPWHPLDLNDPEPDDPFNEPHDDMIMLYSQSL